MCPAVSQVLSETDDGGIRGNPVIVALLLSLCLSRPPSVEACPASCLCASDIISCSGRNLSKLPFDLPGYATRLDLSHNVLSTLRVDWLAETSDRLAALILSRNIISQIEPDSLALAPHLRHLDLSSNRLAVLNASAFRGLEELEVLLLFGNQITQINSGAFDGLRSLQRLYLSGNRLTVFPMELYKGPGGPGNLTFLDLSSNMVSQVPVRSLLSLTALQQGGIYLQGNPLVCERALQAMLEYWEWKQYRSVVDFRSDYPCRLNGDGTGEEPNWAGSQHGVLNPFLVAEAHQIEPGDWLTVPCPGLVPPVQGEVVVFWVTPRMVLHSSTDDDHDPNSRLRVLPNGSLEIRGAVVEDSGTYSCVASRGRRRDPGESPQVAVLVGNASGADGLAHGSGAEHFNTAFTTLASCVVSIVLVLLYLYLTPCRCRGGRGGADRGCGGRAILLCSDPREADSGERRTNGKRVAFLEPQVEDSDKCGPKTPAMNLARATTEGILKNGNRTAGQALTERAHVV
ncbi:amphoterin-induced protein 2-like [Polymixia lowei]